MPEQSRISRAEQGSNPIPKSVAALLGPSAVRAVALPARQPVWKLATTPPAVLRRSPGAVENRKAAESDLRWLHTFLLELEHTRFPAPRPIPLLGGASWFLAQRYAWQTLTYLPGRPLLWRAGVTLEAAGELLARYRVASEACPPRPQRPPPYRSLVTLLSETVQAGFRRRRLLRDAAGDEYVSTTTRVLAFLRDEGLATEHRGVIHGDPTVRNIIATGRTIQAHSIIDFDLAHVDALVADLAYSLYVSARPQSDAIALDLERFGALVRGYSRVRPLDAHHASLLVTLIAGRGLQLIAKGLILGSFVTAPLARVNWVLDNRPSLEDAAAHNGSTGGR